MVFLTVCIINNPVKIFCSLIDMVPFWMTLFIVICCKSHLICSSNENALGINFFMWQPYACSMCVTFFALFSRIDPQQLWRVEQSPLTLTLRKQTVLFSEQYIQTGHHDNDGSSDQRRRFGHAIFTRKQCRKWHKWYRSQRSPNVDVTDDHAGKGNSSKSHNSSIFLTLASAAFLHLAIVWLAIISCLTPTARILSAYRSQFSLVSPTSHLLWPEIVI